MTMTTVAFVCGVLLICMVLVAIALWLAITAVGIEEAQSRGPTGENMSSKKDR